MKIMYLLAALAAAFAAAGATAPARRAAVVPVEGWLPADDPCDYPCKCTGSTNAATGQCTGSVRCCKCTGMHAVFNMCANIVCGNCVGDGCLQCIGGPNPSPLAGTEGPTASPTTPSPTLAPTTASPTGSPTSSPTKSPTASPVLSGPSPITIANGAGTALSPPEGDVHQSMLLSIIGGMDGCTIAFSYGQFLAGGGNVLVYERTDDSSWAWVQELSGDAAEQDVNDFGRSIAIKGDTMVVGAYTEDNQKGAAYVFVKENNSWVRKTKLESSDLLDDTVITHGTQFGLSAGIDNDTIVVGAPLVDAKSAGVYGQGAAYIYYKPVGGWGSSSTMQPDHKIMASQRHVRAQFGESVAINRDTIAVGAGQRQKVYLYRKNEDNSWGQGPAVCDPNVYQHETVMCGTTENKVLTHQTATNWWALGMSLSDNLLIIGDAGVNSHTGAVHIYSKDSSGDFEDNPNQTLVGNGARSNFGHKVSLDGPNLVVGAPEKNSARGVAYLFTQDAAGSFGPGLELTASDGGSDGDRFGNSVGVGGGSIFVGAHRATVDGAPRHGKVYMFGDPSQAACPSV